MRAELGIGRLFDTVRDAVVIASAATGRIALWNPAAERLFGHTAEEAEGQRIELIIPPRYRERHRTGLAGYNASGHGNIIDSGHPVLLPGLRKDGEEVDVELMLSPLDTERGRYVIAVLRDVTERQRRESDLRRANEDLEAFSFVVSHDLKEPVRALENYLEALEHDHGKDLGDDAQWMLRQARAANDRLRRHLERLLDYARASRTDVARAPLDVSALARSDSCLAVYGDVAKERAASVLVEPDGPRVLGNPETLCQALGNLILNAIKHNAGPLPAVRVRVEPERNEATIVVADNGPGFPPHVLRLFAEGTVTPGAGPRGGFGLAIARRAVERLGGRMSIANAPEGGAVVRLTLPAAPH